MNSGLDFRPMSNLRRLSKQAVSLFSKWKPHWKRRWLAYILHKCGTDGSPTLRIRYTFGNTSCVMRKSKIWRWFSTSHLWGSLVWLIQHIMKSETLCPRQIRYTSLPVSENFGRKSPTEKRAEKIRQKHACCSLYFFLICILFKAGVRFPFPANTNYWTSGTVDGADAIAGDLHMSCQLSTNCLWRVTAAAVVASGDANVCCRRRLVAHQSCFACDAFSITNVYTQ